MSVHQHGPRAPWLAFCVVAAIVLAACGPSGAAAPASATPAGAATPTSTGPVNLGPLKVGLGQAPPDMTVQHFFHTNAQGFYKKRGLDVEIKPFNGNVTALRALVSGDVDVIGAGCDAAMQAIEVGSPLRIISAFAPRLDYVLAAQRDIASPKNLVGKSLGVSQPGAVSWTTPRFMIQADGGDFSKVNVVSIGGTSARVQALAAKKIDASVLTSFAWLQAAKYDFLHVIADSVTALPDLIYDCEVTTEKVFASRKPALQAFVSGTMEGVRWFSGHVNEAAAITSKVFPDYEPAIVTATFKAFAAKQYWNESGALSEKAWTFTNKAMTTSGDLKGPLDYTKIVVNDLALQAQKELGTK